MTRLSRYVSLLLISLTLLTPIAFAANPTLSLSTVEASPDQTVNLGLNFENAHSVCAVQSEIRFEANTFDIESITLASQHASSVMLDWEIISEGIVRVVAYKPDCSGIADGDLATVKIKVSEQASAGKYDLPFESILSSDKNATAVNTQSVAGKIIINDKPLIQKARPVPSIGLLSLLILGALVVTAAFHQRTRKFSVFALFAITSSVLIPNYSDAQNTNSLPSEMVGTILERKQPALGEDCNQDGTVDVRDIMCQLCDPLNADNQPPIINPIADRTLAKNTPLKITAQASDPDKDQLTFSINSASLPDITIDANTGLINWQGGKVGQYTVTVSVTDGHHPEVSTNFTINVVDSTSANQPPKLLDPDDQSVSIGQTITVQLIGTDPDNDTLTYLLDSAPLGMTIDADTGKLSWTVTRDAFDKTKTVDVTVSVTDSISGTDTQTFTLTLTTNPPILEPIGDRVIKLGEQLDIQLYGRDPDIGDVLTYSLSTLPKGMSLSSSTGAISWTPEATGTYYLTATVTDQDGQTDRKSFTIRVQQASTPPAELLNHAPVLTVPNKITLNVAYKKRTSILSARAALSNVKATATDVDLPNDKLTFKLLHGPQGLTIDADTGQINWSTTEVGLYSVSIKVTDRVGLEDVDSFIIEVLSKNGPPSAINDEYLAYSQEVLTIPAAVGLLQNDSDPDEDAIEVIDIIEQPKQGKVKVNKDGSFEYTPSISKFRIYDDVNTVRHSAEIEVSSESNANSPSKNNLSDGFIKSGWLSTTTADATPTITLSYSTPITAKTLRIAMPQSQSYLPKTISAVFYDKNDQILLEIKDQPPAAIKQWYEQDLTQLTANNQPIDNVAKVEIITTKANASARVKFDEIEIIGNGPSTKFVAEEEWRFEKANCAYHTPLAADIDNDGIPEVFARNQNGNFTFLAGNTGKPLNSFGQTVYSDQKSTALADVNNDGYVETITKKGGKISIWSHEGDMLYDTSKIKFQNRSIYFSGISTLSISDLNSDGKPEIISDSNQGLCAFYVENSQLELFWCTAKSGSNFIVADVNLDGKPEVISNKEIVSHDGKVLKKSSVNFNAGIDPALANLNSDPFPEFVFGGAGKIVITDHELNILKQWSINHPNAYNNTRGGAPTIADFDNDGEPEIAIAGSHHYQVWETDGTLVWASKIFDTSSSITGSTVFDFENDGIAEVVYRDEQFLYVYRGFDGKILMKYPVRSGTGYEYPIVVDVDGDNQAEIVVSQHSRTFRPDGTPTQCGIVAFGSPLNNWANTRPIWNQYSYHITNINDDGTVPKVEKNNWLTPGLNNYRQNMWDLDSAQKYGDSFKYKIKDPVSGGESEATVKINIRPSNNQPDILSEPVRTATTGFKYRYDVFANDIDNDKLTYELTNSPTGMSINANTGLITWLPDQTGQIEVGILVTDARGFSSAQGYTLTVTDPIEIPDFTGLTLDEIKKKLKDSGLTLGEITEGDSDTIPKDSFISSDPQVGSVATPSQPINIVISSGPSPDTQDKDNDGYTPAQGDCDDTNSAINPNAVEIVGNNIDEDCDGVAQKNDIVRLELQQIGGKPLVGETVELRLYAILIDKSRQDVSDSATWKSADTSIGSVQNGDVLGKLAGTVNISATHNGQTLSSNVSFVAPLNAPQLTSLELVQNSGQPYVGQTVKFDLFAVTSDGKRTKVNSDASWSVNNNQTATVNYGAVLGKKVGFVNVTAVYQEQSVSANLRFLEKDTKADPKDPKIVSLTLQQTGGKPLVGETVQLRLFAVYDDKSRKDISANSTWKTNSTNIATVTNGNTLGVKAGTVNISATHNGQTLSTTINFVDKVTNDTTLPSLDIHQPIKDAVLTDLTDVVITVLDENLIDYRLKLKGQFGTKLLHNGQSSVTNKAVAKINPTTLDGGNYLLELTAVDQAGNSQTINSAFTIDKPKIVSISVNPGSLTVLVNRKGKLVATGELSDGNTKDISTEVTWTSADGSIASVTNGLVSGLSAGQTSIMLAYQGATLSIPVTVVDENNNDATPPDVAITSPKEVDVVESMFEIIGTAKDDNFLNYQLDYAYGNSENYTLIKSGSAPVDNGVLGKLDPTLLTNGLYTLRLTVMDKGGNATAVKRSVIVDGDLKIGNFSIGFTDLTIPANGMPLTVGRIYDTFRHNESQDFGYGWQQTFSGIRASTNGVLGKGWQEIKKSFSIFGQRFPLWSIESQGEHIVSVIPTFGPVEHFRMVLRPSEQKLIPIQYVQMDFEPMDKSSGSKLEALSVSNLKLWKDTGYLGELDAFGAPVDPDNFKYTTEDGIAYVFNKNEGLKRVIMPDGSTLTYTKAGIQHSNGQSIVFKRDSQGRIISITDPEGNAQTYQYDASGNQVAHTDAMGNETTFVYDAHHRLMEIHDPMGNRAMKNEYDAEGRLIAQIDAEGNRISYNFALNDQTMTVNDALGYPTKFKYDAKGNIIWKQETVTIDGKAETITTEYEYDANGNETVIIDADGVRTEQKFDSKNHLVKRVIDPQGLNLVTTTTYNDKGKPVTVTDAAGRQTNYSYDSKGEIASIQNDDGMKVSYVPEGNNLIKQMDDPQGSTWSYKRDDKNRIIETTVIDNNGTQLAKSTNTYDDNGNILTETTYREVNGVMSTAKVTHTYDDNNNRISSVDALGNKVQFEYDKSDRQIAIISPTGARTEYRYNSLNQLEEIIYPDGSSIRHTYNENGNKLTTTSRSGNTTKFEYDELGRPIAIITPDGSKTQKIYSPAGRLTATIDAKGNRTDYIMDAASRIIEVILPEVTDATSGQRERPSLQREYNKDGKVTKITNPNSYVTQKSYDSKGRLTKTTFADNSTSLIGYDAYNRPNQYTDPLGRSKKKEFDGQGSLLSVTLPSPSSGQSAPKQIYTYTQTGQLATETDPLNRQTTYEYNQLGYLTRKTLANGQSESYTYDQYGRMKTITDLSGQTFELIYDNFGRIKQRKSPDGNIANYSYTASGEISSIADASGIISYEYDVMDRVSKVTHADGRTISYKYDANGNLTSLTTPNQTIAYDYDALDRLDKVSSVEGVTTYGYDLASNLVETVYPNGASTEITHDSLNRPEKITYYDASGYSLDSMHYVFTKDSQVKQISFEDGSVERFVYDNLNRLISETRTGSNPREIKYEYDLAGNRTAEIINGQKATYHYDEINRLTKITGARIASFTYDANGNRTQSTEGGQTVRYEWDSENHLITVRTNSNTVNYNYDALGNQISKTVNGTTTSYLISDLNPTGYSQVLEVTKGDTLVERNIFGIDLIAQTEGNETLYQHADMIGTVRLQTDENGQKYKQLNYTAFGEADSLTDGQYAYTGERFDAYADATHLRARYYDANTGVFLGRDAFEGVQCTPASRQPYQYVYNNPVNMTDPSGYFSLGGLMAGFRVQNTLSAIRAYRGAGQVCRAYAKLATAESMMFWGSLALAAFDYGQFSYFSGGYTNPDGRVIWKQKGVLSDVREGELRLVNKGFQLTTKDKHNVKWVGKFYFSDNNNFSTQLTMEHELKKFSILKRECAGIDLTMAEIALVQYFEVKGEDGKLSVDYTNTSYGFAPSYKLSLTALAVMKWSVKLPFLGGLLFATD